MFFGLVQMVKILGAPLRREYLSVLWELASESDVNWRFRLFLAEQLDELVYLYPVDVVKEQMVPLMLQLCQDRMADVRYAAVYPMADAIKLLDAAGDDLESVRVKLEAIYKGRTYSKRLLYIRIAESCAERLDADLFDRLFVDDVVGLALDQISNVRFCCGRFLEKWLWTKERYRNHEGLLAAVERLKNDEDDVEIRRFGEFAICGMFLIFKFLEMFKVRSRNTFVLFLRLFASSDEIEEWLQSQREEKRRREREEFKAQRDRERQQRGDNDPLFENTDEGDDSSLDDDGVPKNGNPQNGTTASTDDLDSTDSSLYSSSDSDDADDAAEGDEDLDADDDDENV